MWLSHGLALLGTPSESESVGFSPGTFTPWSQGRTPSLVFARVSWKSCLAQGLSRSCPFCLLKGGGWKNLWTPFLNPCSLLNSNEQGKETRVPELSKEEGMIVCKQGGQEVTPGG